VCAEEPEPTSFVGVKNKYCAMGYTNVKESDRAVTTKQLKRMMRKMTFNLFKDNMFKWIRRMV
jgi:zona occludens toxin (predicted ATPase)